MRTEEVGSVAAWHLLFYGRSYGLQTAPDTPQTGLSQASASQQGRLLEPIMAIMFRFS